MTSKREKLALPTAAYLKKAKDLPKAEAERLMSRMRGRFLRRLEDERLTQIETIALQLAHEDEQLEDWRKNIAKLRDKKKEK